MKTFVKLVGIALLCLTFAAQSAQKYYVTSDVVRGQLGAQGAVCVANTVFYPGEQMVWRAMVFDAATHKPLTIEQVKEQGVKVSVALENGARLDMRFGLHPPNPKAPVREAFFSVNYPLALTAPIGTLKWSLSAVDKDGHTGGFSPIGQEAGLNVLTIAKPTAPIQKTAATDGQALYGQFCQACHQQNGQGAPGNFPPLAGSAIANGDRAYMARVALYGLEGPLSIKGQKFEGSMPGMADLLSDSQIASLLSYVRSSWGNAGGVVAPDVVAAERNRQGTGRDNHARYPR